MYELKEKRYDIETELIVDFIKLVKKVVNVVEL
jgi:hypothetical protein